MLSNVLAALDQAGLLITSQDMETIDHVSDLSHDSRQVKAGCLFFCKGANFNSKYLKQAAQAGAVAYVSEHAYEVDLPYILVSDIRQAIPIFADIFYQSPWQAFNLVGITGTKGKTTTTDYLKKMFDLVSQAKGRPESAYLSSNQVYDGILRQASQLTTPEPLDLFRHFDHARQAGVDYLTMEVSSQALKYHRVDRLVFDAVAFLNISDDHVSPSEHPDFEDYFSSKLKIFNQAKFAVLNEDADHYDRILSNCTDQLASEQVVTVSRKNPQADYYGFDLESQGAGQSFTLKASDFTGRFELSLAGDFNVDNALVVIAIGRHFGIPYDIIRAALAAKVTEGRMDIYQAPDEDLVAIVDFAHNKLSFEAMFQASRQLYPGYQIYVVFGAPGNKAISRRQDMAQVAAKEADQIIITADDPDFEDVDDINQTIYAYVQKAGGQAQIIADRPLAIQAAFDQARASEKPTVILLLGKGDEAYLKYRGGKMDYAGDTYYAKQGIKQK